MKEIFENLPKIVKEVAEMSSFAKSLRNSQLV